jgi:hypothetical protein
VLVMIFVAFVLISPKRVPGQQIDSCSKSSTASSNSVISQRWDAIEVSWGRPCGGLLIENYIAFYIVETNRIVIVRVLDGRMDISRETSQ